MSDLVQVASAIKMLVLDVDGVLSNGHITYDDQGREIKSFNVKDGLGIKALKHYGILTTIITGRESPMVSKRAQEMGIDHVIQGRDDKLTALTELLAELNITLEQCAYVGDDLPDIKALQSVGLSATVANAHPEVLKRVMMVTTRAGGEGAVREVCDLILRGHGVYEDYIARHTLS